jgi:hypothetical protein
MNLKWKAALACLVCLMLASTLAAQDDDIAVVQSDMVIRLASPSVAGELDVATWLATGELKLSAGPVNNPNKATPGPAPAPGGGGGGWGRAIFIGCARFRAPPRGRRQNEVSAH